MAHQIFISHSPDDRNVADAACAAFEARGFRCWIAPRDLPLGGDPGDAVAGAIARCRVLVLILSSRSAEAPHLVREAERALAREVPILVFRIEEAAPSPALGRAIAGFDWLDALTPPVAPHLDYLGDRVARLLDELPKGRERTMPPQPFRPAARGTPAWLPIAGAGVAGLLAIALAAMYGGR